MKLLLLFITPFIIFAKSYSLTSLINYAHKHNENISSKEMMILAKDKEYKSIQESYWPTLDMQLSQAFVTPNNITNPGQTTTGVALLSINLYDGGRRDSQLKSKNYQKEALLFEKEALKKSLSLEIIDNFFTIKKYQSSLYALKENVKEIKKQLYRVKKFKDAGLSAQEDIDNLQAVLDNNNYLIENTKLAIEISFERLALKSGLRVISLRKNYLLTKRVRFSPYEKLKILDANANSIYESSKVVGSGYKPTVKINESYSKMAYGDTVSMNGLDGILPNHQNRITISLNWRIFDHGKIKREKEALNYQRLSLQENKRYALKEQKMNFRIAKKRLNSIKAKLKSTKSALKASKSSYRVTKKKYEVGLVDYISYLNSLNSVTLSKSRYKETIYEKEIAKSIYYFYAGKKPKEYIR